MTFLGFSITETRDINLSQFASEMSDDSLDLVPMQLSNVKCYKRGWGWIGKFFQRTRTKDMGAFRVDHDSVIDSLAAYKLNAYKTGSRRIIVREKETLVTEQNTDAIRPFVRQVLRDAIAWNNHSGKWRRVSYGRMLHDLVTNPLCATQRRKKPAIDPTIGSHADRYGVSWNDVVFSDYEKDIREDTKSIWGHRGKEARSEIPETAILCRFWQGTEHLPILEEKDIVAPPNAR